MALAGPQSCTPLQCRSIDACILSSWNPWVIVETLIKRFGDESLEFIQFPLFDEFGHHSLGILDEHEYCIFESSLHIHLHVHSCFQPSTPMLIIFTTLHHGQPSTLDSLYT